VPNDTVPGPIGGGIRQAAALVGKRRETAL
jgi:hypothetical protein